MTKINYIEHNGTEHSVEGKTGLSLMQNAVDNLVPGILADCGGCCSCATCHGYIDEAWLGKVPPASDDEKAMLEGALEVKDNRRLICRIVASEALAGIVVRLPASQV